MLSKYILISIVAIIILIAVRVTNHVFGDKDVVNEEMAGKIDKIMFAVYLMFAMLSAVFFMIVVMTIDNISVIEMIGLMVSSSGVIFTAMKNLRDIVDSDEKKERKEAKANSDIPAKNNMRNRRSCSQ